jgi:hypothetical protein
VTRIPVCSRCLRASCWQLVFPCPDAKQGFRATITLEQAQDRRREHPDFWKQAWIDAGERRRGSAVAA